MAKQTPYPFRKSKLLMSARINGYMKARLEIEKKYNAMLREYFKER